MKTYAIFRTSSGFYRVAHDDDRSNLCMTRCCKVSSESGGRKIADSWNEDRAEAAAIRSRNRA